MAAAVAPNALYLGIVQIVFGILLNCIRIAVSLAALLVQVDDDVQLRNRHLFVF